jgi:hypothetical protein
LKLDKKAQQALSKLAASATPLAGTYFRSVEHLYMDPDTVLNGKGAQLRGNRFAPVGTRATYVSDSDKTATEEVTGRKERLGGKALIDLNKYPRVVFGVVVRLDRHVNLARKLRSPLLEKLRQACLHEEKS